MRDHTDMSDADSLLVFHRVSKHYGSVAALNEFSMRVEPGRILGVLGRNGAGKSTMMGLIVGQLAPSSGTLQVLGQQAPLRAASGARGRADGRTRIAISNGLLFFSISSTLQL